MDNPETDDNRVTDTLSRRYVLAAGATGAFGAIAGCLGDDDTSSTPAPTPTERATQTQTPTPTETPTPEDTPTPTPADTPTPTPEDTPTPTPEDTPTPTPAEPDYDLPTSGEYRPALQALDEATIEYMTEREYGAGSLALYRDDEIVFQRGYGWADEDQTDPLSPDPIFRIASITKWFTDDAVLRLVEEDELALDDTIYEFIDVEPPERYPLDSRIYDITVEHLLSHEGGWDRRQHENPLFNPMVVVEEFDLGRVPERDDFVRYMLDQPMQFDPGTNSVYSNIGYVFLSLVVESVTGDTLESVFSQNLFEPAGATDIQLGATRPDERHPDEVWYDDSERCPNVYEQNPNTSSACADYGLNISAFSGAGGFVARASDLARALDEIEWWWEDGQQYESIAELSDDVDARSVPLIGSLNDSFALASWRPDTWVVSLFNDRTLDNEENAQIWVALDDALEGIEGWP
jgi:CubicO group peptidase (beta-lactamase class C family)